MLSLFFILGCSKQPTQIAQKQVTQNKRIPFDNKQEFMKQDETQTFSAIEEQEDDSFKVAVVFPSKVVGKYAKDTINTVLAYMLHNNVKFKLEIFDSTNQDINNIQKTFDEVIVGKFDNVIALYTQEALDNIFSMNKIEELNIYMPLINKRDSKYDNKNVVYGGIDYDAQISKLLTLSNKKNSIFYSNTNLGMKLKSYVEQSNQDIRVVTKIDKRNNEFKKIVKKRGLNNSSLFLNTSIIKSSILLSQLRAHETVPYIILSTQLNYTPLVISLTQYPDRKKFIVANSIEKTDLKLQESLALLNVDIAYNWVNYSTLIGIDSIMNNDQSKLFPLKIQNNQVQYGINLYKNTRHGFKKLRTN